MDIKRERWRQADETITVDWWHLGALKYIVHMSDVSGYETKLAKPQTLLLLTTVQQCLIHISEPPTARLQQQVKFSSTAVIGNRI